MKKLFASLLFVTIFQTVLPATSGGFCSYAKAGTSGLHLFTDYKALEAKKLQTDFHPLYIFDLQFD